MATSQQVAQIQKAIQVATEVDKSKQHIQYFSILAVVCAIGVINVGLKQYDSTYDFIDYIFKNDYQSQKYVYYAIAIAGLGLIYYAYKLYPLAKMMKQ